MGSTLGTMVRTVEWFSAMVAMGAVYLYNIQLWDCRVVWMSIMMIVVWRKLVFIVMVDASHCYVSFCVIIAE